MHAPIPLTGPRVVLLGITLIQGAHNGPYWSWSLLVCAPPVCKAIDAYGLCVYFVIDKLQGGVSTKGVSKNREKTYCMSFGMFRFGLVALFGVGQCGNICTPVAYYVSTGPWYTNPCPRCPKYRIQRELVPAWSRSVPFASGSHGSQNTEKKFGE